MNDQGSSTEPASETTAQRMIAQAMVRAQLSIAWEQLWPPLAKLLTVAGFFLAISWAGVWLFLPLVPKIAGLVVIAALALAALFPLWKFRWPTREAALRRLDLDSSLAHRPATTLADTLKSDDPVSLALWQAQRARTLALLDRIRVKLPSPQLARHDPWALRALVAMMAIATYVAAGDGRMERVAAAFDWNGAFAGSNVRVDAWIDPPPYTSRPPIVLSGGPKSDAQPATTVSVPVGSVLVARSSGGSLEVSVSGGVSEATASDKNLEGTDEHRFMIGGDGTARVRSPASLPQWSFKAVADRAPTIALAKDPERQARGSLSLSYKLDDDYGVTQAQAQFAVRDAAKDAQPLFDPPQFALGLPNARTRSGVGQTVKDLSENPYAGADVTLTLIAKDEAGNEGRSEPFDMRLPERVFAKPLPRALIEQRRILALDADQKPLVLIALEALLIAPGAFTPDSGQYLGLRSVADQLARANTKDALRETVDNLWALAVTIEDSDVTDAQKALQAAQDALKQALERGASDEEIRKLTQDLRTALNDYLRQLAEQMRNNPQALAQPLDRNARVMSDRDLKNMIDRMERLSRSGDKDAARQLLEQMQQMLENLQMAQPGQGDQDTEQALNELNDLVRKQQQLRDKTYNESQNSRTNRGGHQDSQNNLSDLQQDQQALQDRLQKLLGDMKKKGMMPNQQGEQGQQGQPDDDSDSGSRNPLADADNAMGEANSQLGHGSAGGAVDAQGRALEALRKGAQNLAQQGQGDGEGQPGSRLGKNSNGPGDTDPLGRPLKGREYSDDQSVKIPDEIDVQRVRRILEELRRRLGETQRPKTELDYLERLLKDY